MGKRRDEGEKTADIGTAAVALHIRQAIDAFEPALVVLTGEGTAIAGRRQRPSLVPSLATRLKALKGGGGTLLLAETGLSAGAGGGAQGTSGLSPALVRLMAELAEAGLAGIVHPVPAEGASLAATLRHFDAAPAVVVIETEGDEAAVGALLAFWWPLLQSPGVLIGRGWRRGGEWPALYNAFQVFARTRQAPVFLSGPSRHDGPGGRRGGGETNSVYVTKLFAEGGRLADLSPRLEAEYRRFREDPASRLYGEATLMERKALRNHAHWLRRRGWEVAWEEGDVISAHPRPGAAYRFAASLVDAWLFLRRLAEGACNPAAPGPWPDPALVAAPVAREEGEGAFALFLAKTAP